MTTLQDNYADGWFHEGTRVFVADEYWQSTLSDEQIKSFGWIRARERNHIVIIDEGENNE